MSRLPLLPVLFFVGLAAPAAQAGPDWDRLADLGVIRVLTQDEDGDERVTKVWFAVVDGQGFLRTGSSRWGDNLERDPRLVLRIEGEDYPLRADFIHDPEHRAQIEAVFREKYGWSDRFIGMMRGANPRIMHMLPR